ncbi:DNA-binding IclR family transcriptional regulator [Paraburkholderia sp. RAU6.4a]|uniref:IclR family transcriptional regulator n=1 Tax=unclassified Paraburkholderia TaxID=2615204 RepID=UPI0016201EC1|nr:MULTISPECIES: IclR family transcriptional regulator [unclassified Paraburkholderia]MBB5413437.1 DNA-binding IclR family transcriptional regulator [Paraburkholderia sp. HC6.4b]MBB5455718.1 DNA-binding IclR family transcriptional regulator [Paraburkholderia sp. Kb1A]
MEEKKPHENVRAVERALEILLAFRPGDKELTVAELLTRVDLSRPTLYRLLNTLEQNGFLASSGEPQRFRLGSSVAQLAHAWMANNTIAQLAQPMLRELWKATSETVALFVPEGTYRICVAELESPQPLSFRRGVGYREKLVLGASGRTILSQMPLSEDDLRRYLTDPDQDVAALAADLDAVRARGFGTSHHELIAGAVAVAAPFFNGANQVAGSVCIFGPSVRVTDERVAQFAELLKREVGNLSRALGHQGETARPPGTARR